MDAPISPPLETQPKALRPASKPAGGDPRLRSPEFWRASRGRGDNRTGSEASARAPQSGLFYLPLFRRNSPRGDPSGETGHIHSQLSLGARSWSLFPPLWPPPLNGHSAIVPSLPAVTFTFRRRGSCRQAPSRRAGLALFLDHALQRPRAVGRVVALLAEPVLGRHRRA